MSDPIPTPLSFYFFFFLEREWGRVRGGERILSRVEPDEGLDLTTPVAVPYLFHLLLACS